MGRDVFHLISLPKAPSNLSWNTSNNGTFTTSPDNLFQCLTTLLVKKLFLMSNLNLPPFCLNPLPFVLSLQVLVKSFSAFIWSSVSIEKPQQVLPEAFSSPG